MFFSSCSVEPLDSSLRRENTNSDVLNSNPNTNGVFKVKIDGEWFVSTENKAVKSFQPGITNYSIIGTISNGSVVKFVSIQFFYFDSYNLVTGIPNTTNKIATVSYTPNANVPDPDLNLFLSVNFANPFTQTGNVNIVNNEVNRKISGNFNCIVYLDNQMGGVSAQKTLSEGILDNITYTVVQ